jgi:hypothetical protein
MIAAGNDDNVNKRFIVFGFSFVLLLAWYCYSASFGAMFQLDDQANLSGLATVTDWQSAVNFVTTGSAGPTGRPLALLTFALQADQWQVGAAAFLRVNVFIHLLNAMLLAWCVRQLFMIRGEQDGLATLLGCTVSSIWVLLPLLATSSLLVVQRMTTLSALLMLLGLAGYLAARASIGRSPRRALILMGASLTFATILAALAKESGLLLPSFVLVLELTILTRPNEVQASDWKKWSMVFLWLPGILLLGYLASRASYPDYMIARRDFDGGERLLTEARILWLYLSKALLGLPGRLGIYHADFAIAHSFWSPITLLASLSWLAVTISALVWRRRYPLFALAILWYLVGHIIESTVVPLELYFEHRNYFPIIGPIFALTAFLFLHSEQIRRIALLVVPLVLLVNAWFLYSFASLLGDSSMASRYWAVQHPHSVRAVTNLATYQLAEESIEQGIATIHQFANEYPRYAYIRIQELNLRCLTAPAAPLSKELGEIEVALSAVDFSYTAGEMLSQLFTTTTMVSCVDVRPETVMQLAAALHSNPRYEHDPTYNQFHHKLLAGIYRHLGDAQAMRIHLDKAIGHRMSAELVMMMTMTMAEANEYAQAREFLSVAAEQTPRNPFWAVSWRQNIDDLHRYLDALEDQNLE